MPHLPWSRSDVKFHAKTATKCAISRRIAIPWKLTLLPGSPTGVRTVSAAEISGRKRVPTSHHYRRPPLRSQSLSVESPSTDDPLHWHIHEEIISIFTRRRRLRMARDCARDWLMFISIFTIEPPIGHIQEIMSTRLGDKLAYS